ncbi:MAG: hypothetical protein JXA07_12695 [Spirochaetes bacterium]|nr:hypothetical protein [Spirochaetota bacterium]
MYKNQLLFKTKAFIHEGKFYDVSRAQPLCRFHKDLTAETPDGKEIKTKAYFTILRTANGQLFFIASFGDKEICAPIEKIDSAREHYLTADILYAAAPEFGVPEA